MDAFLLSPRGGAFRRGLGRACALRWCLRWLVGPNGLLTAANESIFEQRAQFAYQFDKDRPERFFSGSYMTPQHYGWADLAIVYPDRTAY